MFKATVLQIKLRQHKTKLTFLATGKMQGTSWTNYGDMDSPGAFRQGNSTYVDKDQQDGTPTSIAMCAMLVSMLFIAFLFIVTQKLQHSRSNRAASETRAEEGNESRRDKDIKDLLKVFEYPLNETDSDSSDGEAPCSVDLEAQQDGRSNSEADESGAFSVSAHADCAICLGPFKPGQQVCEGNNEACIHNFHESCMTAWLLRHDECPICRQEYLAGV